MSDLRGVEFTQKIFEDANTLVWRGRYEKTKNPIIVKQLKGEPPTLQDIARIKHEYEILLKLKGSGAVQVLSLEELGNAFAIVMEDDDSRSLDYLLKENNLSLKEILVIMIGITEALEAIHKHAIIHKDLCLQNILWNKSRELIKIIDFATATTLQREKKDIQNPNSLEGTLPYISPELTGRLNRSVDYRTDYYSLGIVFYYIATGQLPFESTDALEIVHAHIAKSPEDPHKINRSIPPVLASIILKLMAKSPEERYQSAIGIKSDLQNCLDQLNLSGRIDDFTIGLQDAPSNFQIPEKLYGRETEIQKLFESIERTMDQDVELLLVTGHSGIGKSRLIYEINRPLAGKSGYFISGKFEQFNRNVPYTGFIQAFQSFLQQILAESEERRKKWQALINEALFPNAQVLIDVIPQLANLLGEQPPVPQLGFTEARNRFNLAFHNLLAVIAKHEHPLVIFLDDLQWADRPSIKLLEILLTQFDSRHFLFIGAYRDNEVEPTHPLMAMLDNIRKEEVRVTEISLVPLQLPHVKQLVSDALHCNEQTVTPLAEICFEKTQGNPFFLGQFLYTLYKEQLLKFNTAYARWEWHMVRIEEKAFTNDIVEFMEIKLKELPIATQKILQRAAALSSQFDLRTLTLISQLPAAQVEENLWPALQEGLLLPVNNSYKHSNYSNNTIYQFLHSRVQQAAYHSIDVKTRQFFHLIIGRFLLKNVPKENLPNEASTLANHFNFGLDLIDNPHEKKTVADLNLMAGMRAKRSIAYKPALNYFKSGIKLLESDSWEKAYDLSLALYTEAMESAYLANEFTEMENYADVILLNAKTTLDKMKVYETKIPYYSGERRNLDAINTAHEGMKLLGINFKTNPSKLDVFISLLRLKLSLFGKSFKHLEALKVTTDPRFTTAMRLRDEVGVAAYFTNINIVAMLVFDTFRFTLKNGTGPESSITYIAYALILSSVLKDYEKAYEFGQLALSTVERFQAERYKAQTSFLYYSMVAHWKNHMDQGLVGLQNAFQKGWEVGDLLYTSFSASNYIGILFFTGKPLSEVATEAQKYAQATRKIGQKPSHHHIISFWQLALQLSGDNPESIESKTGYKLENEAAILTQQIESPGLQIYYLQKVFVNFLTNNLGEAYTYLPQLIHHTENSKGLPPEATCYLIGSLVLFSYYHSIPVTDQKPVKQQLKNYLKQFKRWAAASPCNHQHKYYLLLGEWERVFGHPENALKHYNEAIRLAREQRYFQEAAIANELAAICCFALMKKDQGLRYLQNAYEGYQSWGAIVKTNQLAEAYPELRVKDPALNV